MRYMDYAISFAWWNFLVEDPSWAQDLPPSGKPLMLGETLTRRRYADTLDLVADKGADVFYTISDMLLWRTWLRPVEDKHRQNCSICSRDDHHLVI